MKVVKDFGKEYIIQVGGVTEIQRNTMNLEELSKIIVTPISVLKDGIQVPKGLGGLVDLSLEYKKDFICRVWLYHRSRNALNEFPEETQLLIHIVSYWIGFPGYILMPEFATSVLLCRVSMEANRLLKEPNFSSLALFLNNNYQIQYLKLICTKTNRYYQAGVRYPRIVHEFTRLQSCLLFGNHLNQLLGSPIPCIKPHIFLMEYFSIIFKQISLVQKGYPLIKFLGMTRH